MFEKVSERTLLIIISILLFIFVLVLYVSTLPDIATGYADSDELITVANIFGVAHPPSYPLYTMFNIIFGRIPLPLSFAGKLNLLSTFFNTGTVVLVFLATYTIVKNIIEKNKIAIVISLLGVVSLAVMHSFWFYSLFTEVFSLNNFITALITYILIVWYYRVTNTSKRKSVRTHNNLLFLTAALMGLGLGNQQVIIFMIPAFVFFVLAVRFDLIRDFVFIIKAVAVSLIAFILPYAYLPIAARGLPVINWGNPQTPSAIFSNITRRFYAQASPTGSAYSFETFGLEQILSGTWRFIIFSYEIIGIPLLILSLLGVVYLIRKQRYSFLMLMILGIIGGGFFFSIYAPFTVEETHGYYHVTKGIHERFYILALIYFAPLISFGTALIYEHIRRFNKYVALAALFMLFALPAYMGYINAKDINKNNFEVGVEYTTALLESLEKDAILICNSEHLCFTGVYLQEIKNIRPDVVIITAGFSQYPPDQIRKDHPDFLKTTVQRETLEHTAYLMRDMISRQIDKRPIYMAGGRTDSRSLSVYGLHGDPFYLIPQGCLFRVAQTFEVLPQTDACTPVENGIINSYFSDKTPISYMFPNYVGLQRYAQGTIYFEKGCLDKAAQEFKRTLEITPNFEQAEVALDKIKKLKEQDESITCESPMEGPKTENLIEKSKEALEKKDYERALYYMLQAKSLEPDNLNVRFSLIQMYIDIGFAPNINIELKDILALDPDNQKAREMLEEFERQTSKTTTEL